jgi:hypothetical protein
MNCAVRMQVVVRAKIGHVRDFIALVVAKIPHDAG